MNKESVGYVGQVVINLSIFLLLIAVYTYIDKLEYIGCECAVHPKRDFIKGFSIFALVILFVIMFVPMSAVVSNFGETTAILYAAVKFIFYTVCIVFFYMTLDYTRYLISEKCKCSDDYRKDLIYVGSIIEISVLLLIFLTIVVLPVLFNSVAVVLDLLGKVDNKYIVPFVKDKFNKIRSFRPKLKNIPKYMKSRD